MFFFPRHFTKSMVGTRVSQSFDLKRKYAEKPLRKCYQNSYSIPLSVFLSNFLCCTDHKIVKIIGLDLFQPISVSKYIIPTCCQNFRGVKNRHILVKNPTKFCIPTQIAPRKWTLDMGKVYIFRILDLFPIEFRKLLTSKGLRHSFEEKWVIKTILFSKLEKAK